ncbi:MAG: hypothetical protein ACUVR3_05360, partial [Candidatus Roseilinea sp.]|uniref:hypothetical protein n=1 Tax=Candidatus Roseilinea sp. TaxID=2838777 RepID=UPI00404A2C34
RMEELVQAQQRTEQRMDALTLRMEELAQAQQRTEQRMDALTLRMEELVQAQQRTEQRMDALTLRMEEMTDAVKIVARGLDQVRADVGGLSRSVGYALENEAYRMLPTFLLRQHGLEVIQRLVRTEIAGEEINLFGIARRDGQEVLIVGETKLQLDERRANRQEVGSTLEQLNQKVAAVRQVYPDKPIVPLLITHYARPSFVRQAAEQGVIVVQSFEW